MGVLFFVVNAVFALVILLMVLWASGWALMSKNPDMRYQPMRDDRGSFIKSNTNLQTTELDALASTARGDKRGDQLPYQPSAAAASESKRYEMEADPTYSTSSVAVDRLGSAHGAGGVRSPEPGYSRSASPYGVPPGSASQSPYVYQHPSRGGPMADRGFRSQSPAHTHWQRGVGYGN